MELIKSANGFYVMIENKTVVVCKDLPELFKELEFYYTVPLPPTKPKKKAEPVEAEPVKEDDDPTYWDSEPDEELTL